MYKRVLLPLIAVMWIVTVSPLVAKQYKTNWDSLTTHPIPEWFKDAKFGIYAHLGVYCVPAHDNEWYPRRMYREGDRRKGRSPEENIYDYHQRVYGGPAQFGYKDFIPQFKLEHFDPAAWAELYKQSGAKFAGPVAEHHDGFSMWASQVNRWNAGDMGPKRDVVGELIAELRKRDMKIITSFHHSFNHNGEYYTPLNEEKAKAEHWDVLDPKYGDLYGHYPTQTRSMEVWLAKLKEVIDAYQPDQIWFDFGLKKIPDEYKQQFAAYYYNKEDEWKKPVIITRKGDHMPEGVGVLDIERGRMKDMGQELWQTDDSTAYNSWCWVNGLKVKPPVELVHELIDIVSKNGVLLLNVCPKADGTISPDQQDLLREMGKWLKVNGEAIYATRPWLIFGQGPTIMKKGGGFLPTYHYTGEDVRFTQSKDGKSVYAICLGLPEKPITIEAVQVKRTNPHARIRVLGSKVKVKFEVNNGKLTIEPPTLQGALPCDYAYAFKLVGFKFELDQDAK